MIVKGGKQNALLLGLASPSAVRTELKALICEDTVYKYL